MREHYILGGYTRRNNDGLYEVNFDPETATFTPPTKIATLQSPTFVTTNTDRRWLFAINTDKKSDQAGLIAFVDHDGKWVHQSECYTSQVAGCHVTYRQDSRTLYVANYHEGAIDVYGFNEDDDLIWLQRVQNSGQSVHPNQQSSHMHYTGLIHQDQYLLACDLGTDEIITYAVQLDGKLEEAHRLEVPAGMGPRHLVVHPNLEMLYIIGELNNTTIACQLAADGSLEIVQTITNLPDETFEIDPAGAAIQISQDGRFLYISTRFVDLITVFKIDEITGQLSLLQTIASQGQIPRDMTLSHDERYLLVAHQDSDHLCVFNRCAETGKLEFNQNDTRANECVCILDISH